MYGPWTKALFIYTSIIALCLLTFCTYQACSLGLSNVASNEDIRHRWNGHRRNRKAVKAFRRDAGCCGRCGFILWGNVNVCQGESKVEKYAELVETFYEVQRLTYRKAQQLLQKKGGLATEGPSYDDATQIHGGEPEAITDVVRAIQGQQE